MFFFQTKDLWFVIKNNELPNGKVIESDRSDFSVENFYSYANKNRNG